MKIQTAAEPPFGNLSSQTGKLIEQLQRGFYGFASSDAWSPNVNLYETATAYLVCVDLSGVDKDKIDLQLVDSTLTLRGQRPVPSWNDMETEPGKFRIHLMEIDHGTFVRQVEIPDNGDPDKITAAYRNGMLWVEIPKK
ncbi:MAG TPA: Hsp20/alpha crystallin family protein [Tepidisphaeraceae bacterium]|jgi:HSP20 family protein|nr:Hsp20/alpha crystallin family protein [Tepidisphaeraceae bacterium]